MTDMFEEKINKLIKLKENGIISKNELLSTAEVLLEDVEEFVFPVLNHGLKYTLVYYDGILGYEVSKGRCDNCYIVDIESTYRGLPVIGIATRGFEYLSDLTEFCFPMDLIYIGDGAFSGCVNLSKADLRYRYELSEIGSEAFLGCESLEEIQLPNTIKRIDDDAFSCCDHLRRFEICETFKTRENSITKLPDVCSRCYNLDVVSIESTEIEEIGPYAFSSCESLRIVSLPKTIKKIGKCAFSECYNLQTIYTNIHCEDWDKIEKANDWNRDTPEFTIKCWDGHIKINKGTDYLYSEQWLKDQLAMNPNPTARELLIKRYLDNK